MKKSLISILLLTSSISYGQVIIKEIREMDPIHKTLKYSFPLIIVPKNKKASDKINNELASDFLFIDRNKINKSIFENVWSTKEIPIAIRSDISYKILSNDKTLLNVSISADGCGAYCEYFTEYYTFNIKTGERIILDSLLKVEGKQRLIDSLNKKKREILQMKLEQIKNTLKTQNAQMNVEEKEYYKEMETLYNECLDKKIRGLEYFKFYLSKSLLYLESNRCSAHYNRNLDEIGNFEFELKPFEWKKYFTTYAIKILK